MVPSRFSSYEILVFDDGSTDATGAIAEELATSNPNIKVVHNPKNMGLGYNYSRGVQLARMDYLVMFPGDNQFSRTSMGRILDLVGKADTIVPYTSNSWVRPLWRRIVSRGFVLVMNFLFGLRLRYYTGTVVHRSQLVKAVPITTCGFAYQAEVLIRLIKSGHRYLEVGAPIRERPFGRAKFLTARNVLGWFKTIASLFWEIRIKGRRKYNRAPVRVEPAPVEREFARP